MNRDLTPWIPAIVAGFLLVLVAGQTVSAFQRSGRIHWGRGTRYTVNPADPYNRLENLLSAPDHPPALAGLRDPFTFGRGNVHPVRPGGPVRTAPGPAAPRPTLTAIVTEGNDSRAIVVYESRSYTVRSGDLFAEYKVVSISPDGVVLDNGRERLTLQRPTKGR